MSAPPTGLWRLVPAATSLAISGWLTWQAVVGPAGWRHRARLAQALADVEAAHAQTQHEVADLERRLRALADSPRAQEHAVRDRLGWIRPGERVIHLPP